VIFGPNYRTVVVFASSRGSVICFEPMTAISNGLNMAQRGVIRSSSILLPERRGRRVGGSSRAGFKPSDSKSHAGDRCTVSSEAASSFCAAPRQYARSIGRYGAVRTDARKGSSRSLTPGCDPALPSSNFRPARGTNPNTYRNIWRVPRPPEPGPPRIESRRLEVRAVPRRGKECAARPTIGYVQGAKAGRGFPSNHRHACSDNRTIGP